MPLCDTYHLVSVSYVVLHVLLEGANVGTRRNRKFLRRMRVERGSSNWQPQQTHGKGGNCSVGIVLVNGSRTGGGCVQSRRLPLCCGRNHTASLGLRLSVFLASLFISQCHYPASRIPTASDGRWTTKPCNWFTRQSRIGYVEQQRFHVENVTS
ncbi:unnamed protein product [Pylaiella littoralis]